MFGYTKAEFSTMNAADLWERPEDRSTWLEAIERTGFVRDYEYNAKRKDGAIRDCIITATKYQAPDRNYSVSHHFERHNRTRTGPKSPDLV